MPLLVSVRKWFRRLSLGTLILVGALIALRIALPEIALRVVNKNLGEKMGEYTGHLEDLDLSIYRGAYQLQALNISKKGASPHPFLTVREIDLSLSWHALFRGTLAVDVVVDKAALHLVDSKKIEERQIGTEEKNWREVFDVLIPIHIQNFELRDSLVKFANPAIQQKEPMRISDIQFGVKNLRTKPKSERESLSPFVATAAVQGAAKLWAKGQVDILAEKPRVNVDYSFTGFQLNSVNRELLAYVPIDLTRGRVDLFGEAALIRDGPAKGYVKVFLSDVDVVSVGQVFKSFKHVGFEFVSAVANWFLENEKSDKVAARIPFSSDGKDWKIDVEDAFWSAIENKDDALKPSIDDNVDLRTVSP